MKQQLLLVALGSAFGSVPRHLVGGRDFLSHFDEMIRGGLVTLERVRVIRYRGAADEV